MTYENDPIFPGEEHDETVFEPVVEPVVEQVPDPLPDPTPEPAPEVFSEPAPAPQPAPEPAAEPVPPVYGGYAPQQQSAPYRASGVGRKESPYANSPYYYDPLPRQEYRYQPQTQPPQKPPKEKNVRSKSSGTPLWRRLLSTACIVALVACSCIATASWVNDYWEERNEKTVESMNAQIQDLQDQIDSLSRQTLGASSSGSPAASGDGLTPSQVYAQNVDSVVAISCVITDPNYYGATGTSSGSGFILSEDGYILTNYHVVSDATQISVIMHDGTEYAAVLAGYDDSANDLALLKVDATGLPAATIGSSSDLIIGDMVVAIGNPLGELTSTQTVGYISGIGREVSTDSLTTIRMIQTDAAINPGNSGGPLFNMKGEVVGITTAKYSGTTSSGASIEGIGFAIPIDDVMNIIDDLITHGYVTGAYMGVSVSNTDEASAAMFGLPTGAYVVSVEPGGPAHLAGLQEKDLIIEVGGYTVRNVTDLTRALRNFRAGDTTTVTVIRGGVERTLDITLAEKPRDTAGSQIPDDMPDEGNFDEWYDYFRRHYGE